MEKLTPMMRQYHQIKQGHPEMLLFFRLGDFYEMFYEDAVIASRELEITLTSRNKDSSGSPIPMCGVPHHAVNNYLSRLIKKGFKVAMCEQAENPGEARGIVRREVTRIVTPGTVIEESVLNSKENNFMAGLCETDQKIGAAFLDLSTGEFMMSEFSGSEAWRQTEQELAHFHAKELVIPEAQLGSMKGRMGNDHKAVHTSQEDWTFNLDYCRRILLEQFQTTTLEGFGVNGQSAALCAAGALLHYVRQTQKAHLTHITTLQVFEPPRYLELDQSTVDNLELVRGVDGDKQRTLLGTVDQTCTAMGARLIHKWLLRPSLDLNELNSRLDSVDELHKSAAELGRLRKILGSVQDLERLLSRITLETANARDLLALRNSMRQLPKLSNKAQSYRSPLLCQKIDCLEDLEQLLSRAIAEDPPVVLTDGGLILIGFDQRVDELREISRSGKSFIAKLEAQERAATGISSLKVKYNKVFGYFIEITKSHLSEVPDHYIRKQTLVGSERFITPELKDYEEKVLTAQEKLYELEKIIFCDIRKQVGVQARRIQQVANVVATIDVLASFSEVARKYHYVRPQLNKTQELKICAGRHPVVEANGTEPFVANDLRCGAEGEQLLILTGPNMGGKSTYLRQNALIVILAQMGSFVPADTAEIGLADRIFTRVGASDNLAKGRSTFMVEMIETARILNLATTKSLILLDEVGRGTATFDGLSIAWSVAEYLLTQKNRKARTLFATHYQELTKLDALYKDVKNYCVKVQKSNQKMVFFHRVEPGVASKSYGIEVARLAGLPSPVVQRAQEILSRLERQDLKLLGRSRVATDNVIQELQDTLF
ncbi:MAG: DNA mismatch repair protein MutS [Acidobacteriota bacterium]|nr:DNA mismatch repair protein MutS [Acidobacteriota bacterium]